MSFGRSICLAAPAQVRAYLSSTLLRGKGWCSFFCDILAQMPVPKLIPHQLPILLQSWRNTEVARRLSLDQALTITLDLVALTKITLKVSNPNFSPHFSLTTNCFSHKIETDAANLDQGVDKEWIRESRPSIYGSKPSCTCESRYGSAVQVQQ